MSGGSPRIYSSRGDRAYAAARPSDVVRESAPETSAANERCAACGVPLGNHQAVNHAFVSRASVMEGFKDGCAPKAHLLPTELREAADEWKTAPARTYRPGKDFAVPFDTGASGTGSFRDMYDTEKDRERREAKGIAERLMAAFW